MAQQTPSTKIKQLADDYFRELPVEKLAERDEPLRNGSIIAKEQGVVFLDQYQQIDFDNFVDELFDLSGRKYHRKGIVEIVERHIVISVRVFANRKDKKRAAVKELVEKLTQAEVEWEVYFSVHNFEPGSLPFQAGLVNFVRTPLSARKQLVAEMQELIGDSPYFTPEKKEFFDAAVGHLYKDENLTWAIMRQSAITGEAARGLALPHLRQVIDTLNFFSCSIRPYEYGAFIYLKGEADNSYVFNSSMNRTPPRAFAINAIATGAFFKGDFKGLVPKHFQYDANGFKEALALLNVSSPNEVQQRLLAGLHWAGRAGARAALKRIEFEESDGEREESFLFYAICLESLLTKPKSPKKKKVEEKEEEEEEDSVTKTLITRCCALLGYNAEDVRSIKKLFSQVYDIRSRIVHQGSRTVSQGTFQQMRLLANECLVKLLLSTELQAMQSEQELEEWGIWNTDNNHVLS